MVHEYGDGVEDPQRHTRPWAGDVALEPEVLVRHEVGDFDSSKFPVLAKCGDWSRYVRIGQDSVAVHYPRMNRVTPEQLIYAEKPGYRYVIKYRHPVLQWDESWDRDLAVFLMTIAARRQALLAHACGFLLEDGCAVLAPGHSGAGKSTLARLLRDSTTGAIPLNDDRVVVRKSGDRLDLFGTPWHGQGGIAVPGKGSLVAVVFISKGPTPALHELPRREKVRRLLEAVPLATWNDEELDFQLDLVGQIATDIPGFEASYPATKNGVRSIIELLSAARVTA
jgi:hypothetical protein